MNTHKPCVVSLKKARKSMEELKTLAWSSKGAWGGRNLRGFVSFGRLGWEWGEIKRIDTVMGQL